MGNKSFSQIVSCLGTKNNHKKLLTLVSAFGIVSFGIMGYSPQNASFVFSEKGSEMHKKKIVVLGLSVERQPVYMDKLNGHRVVFTPSFSEALSVSAGADVIAVNVDDNELFLEQVFGQGYEGLVVVITGSRKVMGRMMELPNKQKIYPVCYRTAPDEIMRLLAA